MRPPPLTASRALDGRVQKHLLELASMTAPPKLGPQVHAEDDALGRAPALEATCLFHRVVQGQLLERRAARDARGSGASWRSSRRAASGSRSSPTCPGRGSSASISIEDSCAYAEMPVSGVFTSCATPAASEPQTTRGAPCCSTTALWLHVGAVMSSRRDDARAVDALALDRATAPGFTTMRAGRAVDQARGGRSRASAPGPTAARLALDPADRSAGKASRRGGGLPGALTSRASP